MKSTKRLVMLLFVALLLPEGVYAADLGIGVNIDTGSFDGVGYGLLVPLRFGNMILEPEVSYYDHSEKGNNSASGHEGRDQTVFSLGTGVYARKQLLANTESYFGARLGYRSCDYSYSQDNSGTPYRYESKNHALFLAPTVGIQYFFSEQFSIGCDIGLMYSDGEYKNKSSSGTLSRGDYSEWNTTSRVAVRGFF